MDGNKNIMTINFDQFLQESIKAAMTKLDVYIMISQVESDEAALKDNGNISD